MRRCGEPAKEHEVIGLAQASKVFDYFWSAANRKGKLSAKFLTGRNTHTKTVDG